MLQYLNHHTVSNDVKMRAATFKGAFLLVEGRSDQKLYIKFTDSSHTQVLICNNRSEVLAAISILNNGEFRRALAIIDADFDRIEGVVPPSANIFYTDAHDAEMMMLACDSAFCAILDEFGSPSKLAEWRKSFSNPLLDDILAQVSKIGALMLHSKRSCANLDFGSFTNALKFSEFTNYDSLQIDNALLVKHVLNRSGHPHRPSLPYLDSMSSILMNNHSIRDLGRGHDALDLLGFGLRHALGSCTVQEGLGHNLERFLRVAYSKDCFSRTALFKDVLIWAGANPPLRIF